MLRIFLVQPKKKIKKCLQGHEYGSSLLHIQDSEVFAEGL